MNGLYGQITSIILSFIMMLSTLISLVPKSESPIFVEQPVRERAVFDEGVLDVKSFDIVVAENGNDKNEGSYEKPLKTPEAAKEKAKLLKNADCGTVTVWFKGGTYSLESALEFTESDKGDIIYRSCPGETVIFSGARELTNWSETTVNGVRAFVTDFTSDNSEKYNSCYKDGERLSRPTFPKSGEYNTAAVNDSDIIVKNDPYFNVTGAFYSNTADISAFKNQRDIDVHLYHYWCDELLPVSSIDASTGRIELRKASAMSISKGDRYVLENVFEALTEPGEWYLDRNISKLYYIPKSGDTLNNTVLHLASAEQLVTLNGISNVAFRGIEFSEADWAIPTTGTHFVNVSDSPMHPLTKNIEYPTTHPQAAFDCGAALTVQNSNGITFTDCTFKNTGDTALMIGTKATDCKVESSLFKSIGANAVFIKGNNTANESEQTKDITITDCHINGYGKVSSFAIGVLLTHAKNCTISQNEIHDGLYTAVSVGWVWGYSENVTDYINVENNLIYDIGQGWLSDMGGIYTLGIQPHTVLRGNIIHDVGCYSGSGGYGGWGIYLDEGSSELLVENNLVYNCSSQGFHQHYGKDNMIRNNIFALNGEGGMRVSKKEDHNSLFFYNNIIVGNDTVMYYDIKKDNFKDNGNIFFDYKHGTNVLSGNSTSISERKYKTEMKNMGYYNGAKFTDPMFKDALSFDFTLAQNSPVFDAGFKAWDYQNAGTLTQF